MTRQQLWKQWIWNCCDKEILKWVKARHMIGNASCFDGSTEFLKSFFVSISCFLFFAWEYYLPMACRKRYAYWRRIIYWVNCRLDEAHYWNRKPKQSLTLLLLFLIFPPFLIRYFSVCARNVNRFNWTDGPRLFSTSFLSSRSCLVARFTRSSIVFFFFFACVFFYFDFGCAVAFNDALQLSERNEHLSLP